MKPKVLGMIMAGGKGTRLYPLTQHRAKPAVPFGGKYRIIDFVLSNFVNSRIYSIYVLVQFKSQSLTEHLRDGWQFGGLLGDYFITPVPAQMHKGDSWYEGTADAIYQNLDLVERSHPDLVAVFGADHIYRMNINQMINYHLEKEAEVTVATLPLPIEQAASMFGVIEIDDNWRITGFEEKPKYPKPMPMEPNHALISMGNYLFTPEVLIREVSVDAQSHTMHDFGASILPSIYTSRRVFAYDFRLNEIPGRSKGELNDYWRDVGTIQAYWEANMDLWAANPAFNLYNRDWPLRTASYNDPPAKFVFGEEGGRGTVVDSIISEGCIISGAWVQNSVLGRNVYIHSDTHLDLSILMDGVEIGRRSRVRRAIVEKNVKIPPDTEIGYDLEEDQARRYVVDESGIVIVPASEPNWFYY